MFYDVPNPIAFAQDVEAILAPDGLWLMEVSYTPWVIRNTAYDTICHEHLEYYSFSTIRKILQQARFKVIDVSRNATNGGSLQVVAAKATSQYKEAVSAARFLLHQEKRDGVEDPEQWLAFSARIRDRQRDLRRLLKGLKDEGHTVMALGASTKGNTLIQSSRIDASLISAVGDVNRDKWGRVLPGSRIPILSEEEILKRVPEYLLILPWHFRSNFVDKLSGYLSQGGRLIFPLPEVEIVGS